MSTRLSCLNDRGPKGDITARGAASGLRTT